MSTGEAAPHRVAAGGARPAQPEPFLRGVAFGPTRRVPYPRALPRDRIRLPGDTWLVAQVPVGVRVEVSGDARAVDIAYETATDELGYRGDGAGVTFSAWSGGVRIAEERAVLGAGTVRLPLGDGERTVVHLPEGMRPTVVRVEGVDGRIEPPPPQPRWVVYGDSVVEGWVASEPALAWPAVVGREQGLDHVNLGYAGAARGEVASAEQVAGLDADVFAVCYGTNCWTRTPHSVGLVREGITAFLDILRDAHPGTPVVVVSPVLRPDAEETPNRLGVTLADIRGAMEEVVERRVDAGDARLALVRGRDLVAADQLGDGIHPDDAGHRAMAAAIGPVVRRMLAP